MNSKEEEYKELFLAEALENYEEVSRLLTEVEKRPSDPEVISAIFRITHTLKGNAAGMGFKKIAEFSHVMEDLFGEVRDGRLQLSANIISILFRAVDILGSLINSLKTDEVVRHRGIQTKLEVLIKNAKQSEASTTPTPSESIPAEKEEGVG
ncbi:MAG: Hpt domain-containing protein, partial [Cyclobacteriaceae bacterium]|nr:Hpt domain-containing protein [Cyclobacteriaceae bacterium]